jgi:hypothetical protein
MAKGKGLDWLGVAILTLCCLYTVPVAAEDKSAAVQPPVESCADVATLLARQEEKTSREFKQLKRDLAALSQQIEEPGLREIFGGVGYILGIFGVAAYVASRRQPGGKG